MAKLTTTDITATFNAVTTINANFALVEIAMENTLSRDGTTPNQMDANLDMNNKRILNLPTPSAANEPVTQQQLTDATTATLSSVAASVVTIDDVGGHYVSINAEAALQEIPDDLASTATGDGASRIGLEDSGTLYTGTDVEAALAEVRATPTATTSTAIELATQAEVDAGTDTIRAVTPDTLTNFSGLSTLVKASFTATLTGMTGATTGTVHYTTEVLDATYTRCTLWVITTLSGTSNATTMTMTGLPAAITPTTIAPRAYVPVLNDGRTQPSNAIINNTSIINFGVPNADWQTGGQFLTTAFVTSGVKGIPGAASFTYIID